GIFILGYYGYRSFLGHVVSQVLSPFDFAYLTSPAFIEFFKHETYMIFGLSIFSLTLILVFMGACGKSAMFPLHIWLPDAMEGPTPVSALIHAATMVVAGVYLVARMFPLFVASPEALGLVQCMGAFTCLFAATIGCTQDDIKRVLAFSTLSQIGYMMFALGVCHGGNTLGYTASLFHLFTHAFFKALLFLGAGSIIHALHTNNVWEMGGLVKTMPITHLTFLVATLAISGIPPFSGFFSKDEILLSAFINHQYLTFVIALLVAGLTSFYMFRVYFLTFWSEAKWHGHVHKPQEASWTMTLPLLLLAVLAAISGFTPIAKWIFYTKSQVESHRLFFVPVFGVLVAAFGFLLAMLFYTGDRKIVDHVVFKSGWVYGVIKHKFYIDEVYLWITKKVIFRFVAFPVAWFDRHIVDGGVNLTAWVTRKAGWLLRLLQTGQVQTYGIWLVSGGLVILLVLLTL
ncbi:MAG: NADH-quinone oxidoreductase subunit L, partial [Bdellovibrio sp.]|nr:NADH-quinone oxidoreductase subunit L [Bdellovibrio sp.]